MKLKAKVLAEEINVWIVLFYILLKVSKIFNTYHLNPSNGVIMLKVLTEGVESFFELPHKSKV
jgi:hypothetical protein